MPSLVDLATLGRLGRLPAPGSWGSAVGLLLGALAARLLPPLQGSLLLGVTFVAAAYACEAAERRLQEHDPGSVILDEVWGMAAVVWCEPWLADSWSLMVAGYLLFRVLDVAKPPPLRLLATLPRGWGIMADDFGAAAYSVLILHLLTRLSQSLPM
jgi:phosphatidylglycerophosphatase A